VFNEKLEAYINSPSEISSFLFGLLNTKKPLVIFDIGACTGEDSLKYSKIFPLASIHSFEPRPDNVEKIKYLLNYYQKKEIKIMQLALSDVKGIASFHISSGRPDNADEDLDYGNKSSSLLAPSEKSKEHFPWLVFNNTIEVETDTLDNYCNENNIKTIDFIHMDVQGAELSVLKGAGAMLGSIKLMWLEVGNVRLYEKQPLKNEIEVFMKKNNFIKIEDTSAGQVYGDCLFLNRLLLQNPAYLIKKYIPFLISRSFTKKSID
jgi:FkbM family methyltransferase